MKLTDGLFHRVFDEVATEYPDIEKEHWIVDIGAAKMADTPENFDVIVMENLYGDILSDVAAQIAGSVGLAGSANIGALCSMFEASTARRRGARDRTWQIRLALSTGRSRCSFILGRGYRGTRSQCLAAHYRRRRSHVRYLHGRNKRAEGGNEGVRASRSARMGQLPRRSSSKVQHGGRTAVPGANIHGSCAGKEGAYWCGRIPCANGP